MFTPKRFGYTFLAIHDVLIALVLLFWPALWHEWLHPTIIRTTFYVPQALGAVLVFRFLVTVFCLRRPSDTGRVGLAYLWGAQVPFFGILILGSVSVSTMACFVYGTWLVASLWIFVRLYRGGSTPSGPTVSSP